MTEIVGVILDCHFFTGYGAVAIIKLSGELRFGDQISVDGHEMAINHMEIGHKAVQAAKEGDVVGVRLPERVAKGSHVYRVASGP